MRARSTRYVALRRRDAAELKKEILTQFDDGWDDDDEYGFEDEEIIPPTGTEDDEQ